MHRGDDDKQSIHQRYIEHKKQQEDATLTDEEYENKPYNELSDEEKKQANDRIADEVEKAGTKVKGRNRDK